MAKDKKILPNWFEGEIPLNSYRSLYKWGNPYVVKHPNSGLVQLMCDTFGLGEADFARPHNLGLDRPEREEPVRLSPAQLSELSALVGPENLTTETYARLRASYGKGMIDLLRLRARIHENLPDAVLAPRDGADVQALVAWCNRERVPLYVFGAGSSVTRGMEAVRGGITLDMSVHMKRVLAFNETDQTITVEPGLCGPELEELLNHAPEKLAGKRRYTCGHFPQSFEYSSVGGWVVTRGAGQNSTYYGKIEDMVISQEMVTPSGVLRTGSQPRSATGPDVDQILMGSEGAFGVLTAVTLRVFRWMPRNRQRFTYLFKSWDEAVDACREVMQCEAGSPSVFRLSDPEETDVAMRMYHIHGTAADSALQALGYKPMQRCMLLGMTDGEAGFSRNVDRAVRRIAGRRRAFDLSLLPITRMWEKSRFMDPYMREDLQDFGVLTDTLECAVTWSQMKEVHAQVRAFVKSHPNTICMTHLSHAYAQGGNLYFIFISRMDQIDEYLALQYGILEAIRASGAAMSHHHGLGKQTAPWLAESAGPETVELFRAIKNHLDPNNVMNPGGTLGLDLSPEQKAKRWGRREKIVA